MKRSTFSTVAISVCACAFAGCPPLYDITLGDWVFQFSTRPPGQTHGLTLHPDQTATAFESVPNGGVLAGTFTWESNGRRFRVFQDDFGEQYVFDGQLASETSASGELRRVGSLEVLATWEAQYMP
jgi:hypothetical protein